MNAPYCMAYEDDIVKSVQSKAQRDHHHIA